MGRDGRLELLEAVMARPGLTLGEHLAVWREWGVEVKPKMLATLLGISRGVARRRLASPTRMAEVKLTLTPKAPQQGEDDDGG